MGIELCSLYSPLTSLKKVSQLDSTDCLIETLFLRHPLLLHHVTLGHFMGGQPLELHKEATTTKQLPLPSKVVVTTLPSPP